MAGFESVQVLRGPCCKIAPNFGPGQVLTPERLGFPKKTSAAFRRPIAIVGVSGNGDGFHVLRAAGAAFQCFAQSGNFLVPGIPRCTHVAEPATMATKYSKTTVGLAQYLDGWVFFLNRGK